MAIWQVPFRLKRLNGVLENNDEVFLQSLKTLEKTLPQEVSWCKFYKQYGNINSTVIEIDFSRLVIDDISLRVDLTCITKQQLQAICDFSAINSFVMVYNDITYDVNIENFIDVFKMSRAQRFLENPSGFLEQLT